MNAPTKRIEASRLPCSSATAPLRALPRHVTAEGCQFLLASGAAKAGERKVFTASDRTRVTGTIRWILEERVGFAFDHPLSATTLAALSDEVAALTSLELFAYQDAPERD